MRYLLGIDLGTTGLKAGVFDLEGRLLGSGYAANEYLPSLPSLPGSTGSAEQDPRSWWDGTSRVVRAAIAEAEVTAVDIAAIGVCGFHHCPVFLDDQGEPTRPCIVTHDARLNQSLDQLRQTGVLTKVTEISGSLVTTGHFPAIYHYVLSNDAESLARTRWIVLGKDYIRYRLTGKIGTEICDATGTNLIAMPEQGWSDELCRLLDVDKAKLPAIGTSGMVFGEVTQEASEATGLASGTPVVCGGGDSHCALVGLGVIGSGQAGMLLGTNSTLRVSFDGYIDSTGIQVWKQQHVVPGKFTVSASSMAGSSVLAWFKDNFCGEYQSRGDAETYRELATLAAKVDPGSDGLFFHPYLHGERSPFTNPRARGSFVGMTHWHEKGHFVRSIMEGVGFCIANCFDLIRQIAERRNEQVDTIRISESGGSRLGLWRQIITDVVDMPIDVVSTAEAGCAGVAMLAGVGIGEYKDIQDAVQRAVHIADRTVPDPKTAAIYRDKRETFNRTYRALESILY